MKNFLDYFNFSEIKNNKLHLLVLSLGSLTLFGFGYAFADTITSYSGSYTFTDTAPNPDVNRLIIGNTGNVGIGVAPTSVRLDVQNTGDASMRLQANGGIAGISVVGTGAPPHIRLRDNDPNPNLIFDIRLADTGNLQFADALGNVKMSITQTGNLGIGQDNPASKLDVNGNLKLSGTSPSTITSIGAIKIIPGSGDVCIGSGC
jgi:hypothetical protein